MPGNDPQDRLVGPLNWFRFMPPGLNHRRYERPLAERRLTGQ
jgi:hypothetical protein